MLDRVNLAEEQSNQGRNDAVSPEAYGLKKFSSLVAEIGTHELKSAHA